jgi:molybdopterin molybdotransferase
MRRIPDNLSPQQAWERLAASARMPVESRPITESLNHVLAEDVAVPEDVPPGDRSFMDGFAVRSVDVQRIPAQLAVVEEVLMGKAAMRALGPSQAMAIPTGGFLPEGADAVVMQEETETPAKGTVVINKAVKPSENVQSRSEDFRKNDVLFQGGHRFRPQDISTLATLGFRTVAVYRRPRVHIVSTGNELVPFSSPDKTREQIRESNSLAIEAACSLFGFSAQSGGIIPDDFKSQRAAVESAMRTSDVILISGGSSVGERDYTMDVIESFGPHHVFFHGLAIRPGNPTIFASAGSVLIFGVPGQPVSSLIVFYLFVLPFLFHVSGEHIEYPGFLFEKFPSARARLVRDIQPLKARTDYVRLKLERENDGWRATPVLGKSASLSTLSRADGFTIVPPGDTPLPKGSVVDVILFP